MGCLTVSSCLCNGHETPSGHATVYEGTVVRVGSRFVTYTVNATHGAGADGGAPTTLVVPWTGPVQVGQRTLVFPDTQTQTRIGDQGITCSNLTLPVAEAIDLALSEDCYDRLIARGFTEPRCDDSPSETGCTVGAGPADVWLAIVLVVAAVWRGRSASVHARTPR